MEDTLNNFFEWLSREVKGWWPVVGYAALAALIAISLDYTVQNALINWKIVPPPELPDKDAGPFPYYNFFLFVALFVWAPLKEEMFMRVVPLAFVTAFVTQSPRVLFTLTAVCAAIFGAIHPYNLALKVLVGISGFFFGLVFLKCGGLQRSYLRASVAAMLAHSFTNILLVLDSVWEFYM